MKWKCCWIEENLDYEWEVHNEYEIAIAIQLVTTIETYHIDLHFEVYSLGMNI
jgi:hypothetical protein